MPILLVVAMKTALLYLPTSGTLWNRYRGHTPCSLMHYKEIVYMFVYGVYPGILVYLPSLPGQTINVGTLIVFKNSNAWLLSEFLT